MGLKPRRPVRGRDSPRFQTDPRGVEAGAELFGKWANMFQTDPRGVEARTVRNHKALVVLFQTDPRGVEAS